VSCAADRDCLVEPLVEVYPRINKALALLTRKAVEFGGRRTRYTVPVLTIVDVSPGRVARFVFWSHSRTLTPVKGNRREGHPWKPVTRTGPSVEPLNVAEFRSGLASSHPLCNGLEYVTADTTTPISTSTLSVYRDSDDVEPKPSVRVTPAGAAVERDRKKLFGVLIFEQRDMACLVVRIVAVAPVERVADGHLDIFLPVLVGCCRLERGQRVRVGGGGFARTHSGTANNN
jgi:hypothetical protein